MKLIKPGVVDLVTMANEGNLPSGNFYGDAQLAPFHDHEDAVSQEIKDTLAEVEAGLKDGSIETGYNPGG